METAVDHILDLRGMIIPVTFLRITQAFREIEACEAIEIVGNDPETIKDRFRILQTFSYELLNINDDESHYRIRLRNGRPVDGFVKNSCPQKTHNPHRC
ncbi:MAG: sulfurtransferase TusA family protein [Proteobacteria bacterium]|nr:sulfurtransferase TusA family protein [Pseudomonadota bacterium]